MCFANPPNSVLNLQERLHAGTRRELAEGANEKQTEEVFKEDSEEEKQRREGFFDFRTKEISTGLAAYL